MRRQPDRRLWLAIVGVCLLFLGPASAYVFVRVARNLARSASVKNVSGQSLRVVPLGLSPDGPVPLPLEPSHPQGYLTVAPGETDVFRYVPGVATFCWLLIVPPQGPMRIKDSQADRESCKPGVPVSMGGFHPAAEYFIEGQLEDLPPAPPELVRAGERLLEQ